MSKKSKSVWIEAGELNFGMTMQHQTTYSNLYFSKIRLRVLLKNSKIFLKNCQKKSKSVCVEAGELKFCMHVCAMNVLKHDFQILKHWIFAVDFWKK
jgi:hypothetical protein